MRSLGAMSVDIYFFSLYQMGWGLVRLLQLTQIGSSWITTTKFLKDFFTLSCLCFWEVWEVQVICLMPMEKSWPNCTNHHKPVSDMLFHRFLRDLLLHMACLNHLLGGSFQGRKLEMKSFYFEEWRGFIEGPNWCATTLLPPLTPFFRPRASMFNPYAPAPRGRD